LIRSSLGSLVLGMGLFSTHPIQAQQPPSESREAKPLEAGKGLAEAPGEPAPAITPATNRSGAAASPAVPPLPKGEVSLLSGMIQSVDHVRDRLVLKAFQGERMSLIFDERTLVSRDGSPASVDDIQPGQQAYVDSTLDGADVFARKIRIGPHGVAGQGSGQIEEFRPERRELLVRDSITPTSVKMRLSSTATIRQGMRAASPSELASGTLVSFTFVPGPEGPTVNEISILASPGAVYTFSGQVADLNLQKGLLVLEDSSSHNTYDLFFDAAGRRLTEGLNIGAKVTAQTQFDGKQYRVRELTVTPAHAK